MYETVMVVKGPGDHDSHHSDLFNRSQYQTIHGRIDQWISEWHDQNAKDLMRLGW